MNMTAKAIKTMTEKETIVYRFALETCLVDFCVWVEDISINCNMTVPTVKGVIGSLVKKGIFEADEAERNFETYHDLFPWTPNGKEMVAFGNENLSEESMKSVKDYLAGTETEVVEEIVEEEKVEKKEVSQEEIDNTVKTMEGIIETFQDTKDKFISILAEASDEEEYVVVIGDVLNHPVVEGGNLVHIGHGRTKDVPKFTKEEATSIGNKIQNGNGLKGHAEEWKFFLTRNIEKITEHINMMNGKLEEYKMRVK